MLFFMILRVWSLFEEVLFIVCIFVLHVFFISNSIFHFSLELLTKIGKIRLKVAKKLLIFLTDFSGNWKKLALFWENC